MNHSLFRPDHTFIRPNRPARSTLVITGLLTLVAGAVYLYISQHKPSLPVGFDGATALQDVQYQIDLGARTPGSQAHIEEVAWIKEQLTSSAWQVEEQDTTLMGHPIQNIVAKRGTDNQRPWIILGAHYDSRMFADHDPNSALRSQPVPGANDGASGVAVLLELARSLPKTLHAQVWLVFFDAEDQGDIQGWDWILGSRAFAQQLTAKPDAVVVIDMIGDKNLDIYYESNSDQALSQAIWSVADKAGYQKQFIPQDKYSMEDDHTPFLEKGIRAVDLIDFDYPYWHTTEDTTDKVSSESLHAVGDTLFQWIEAQGAFQFVGKGGIIEAKILVRGNEMKRTRAQIKAEMMKRFEAKVDQLLDWQEKTKQPNLTQFENELLAARKEISVEMMKAMLSGEQAGTPIEAPLCPKCGKVMENKGKRPQVIETRLGTIQVERTYYACPECGEGFFPSG